MFGMIAPIQEINHYAFSLLSMLCIPFWSISNFLHVKLHTYSCLWFNDIESPHIRIAVLLVNQVRDSKYYVEHSEGCRVFYNDWTSHLYIRAISGQFCTLALREDCSRIISWFCASLVIWSVCTCWKKYTSNHTTGHRVILLLLVGYSDLQL